MLKSFTLSSKNELTAKVLAGNVQFKHSLRDCLVFFIKLLLASVRSWHLIVAMFGSSTKFQDLIERWPRRKKIQKKKQSNPMHTSICYTCSISIYENVVQCWLIPTWLESPPPNRFHNQKETNPLGCTAFRRSNSSFNCFTSSFHMLTYDSAGIYEAEWAPYIFFWQLYLHCFAAPAHDNFVTLLLTYPHPHTVCPESASMGGWFLCAVMNTSGNCCLAFLHGKTFSAKPNFTWISISTCSDKVHYAMVSFHICKSILCRLQVNKTCCSPLLLPTHQFFLLGSFLLQLLHWKVCPWLTLFQPSNVHSGNQVNRCSPCRLPGHAFP